MPLCWAPMAMCQPGCCLYSAAAWCALPGEQALQQPRLCSPDVRLGCRLRVQWSDRGLASMSYHVKTLPGTSQSCSMQALHAPPQMLGSGSTPEQHAQLLPGPAKRGKSPILGICVCGHSPPATSLPGAAPGQGASCTSQQLVALALVWAGHISRLTWLPPYTLT